MEFATASASRTRMSPFLHCILTSADSTSSIETPSLTFVQLYHAICAVCLLSLALKGQQQLLPEAFQHYHQAISSSLTAPSDLNSDRLLYLHFLLLVYDICYATQGPSTPQDMNMWVQHIHHLLRIAQNRNGHTSGELQAYLLWYVLYLDVQASLSGNGTGDFVKAVINHEILLPDWRESKNTSRTMALQTAYPNDEKTVSASVYRFSNSTCVFGAKLVMLALRIRSEAAAQERHKFDPQLVAARQRLIAQMRNEFYNVRNTDYPSFLPKDSPHAGMHLPMLARVTFEFVRQRTIS